MTSDDEDNPAAPPEAVALADVREQLAGRWDCRAITGGYVGIPKLNSGTPIPRYGRTPAELLENILRTEHR